MAAIIHSPLQNSNSLGQRSKFEMAENKVQDIKQPPK